MATKVFVYGTLMKDRMNSNYLKDQKFLGDARLDSYEMYQVRSYPGIVPKDGEYVLGELYSIDAEVLKRLDKLEGEGYLYKRVTEKVRAEGQIHEAYIYVWLKETEGCRKVNVETMPWKPIRTMLERG